MIEISTTNFILSILASFIGGIGTLAFTRWRKRSLLKKIEELDEHEEFINRLSNDYRTLLRSSFVVLLISVGTIALSSGVLTLLGGLFVQIVVGLVLIGTAFLCYQHVASIIKSKDPEAERMRIENKRQQIKNKLDSK